MYIHISYSSNIFGWHILNSVPFLLREFTSVHCFMHPNWAPSWHTLMNVYVCVCVHEMLQQLAALGACCCRVSCLRRKLRSLKSFRKRVQYVNLHLFEGTVQRGGRGEEGC